MLKILATPRENLCFPKERSPGHQWSGTASYGKCSALPQAKVGVRSTW